MSHVDLAEQIAIRLASARQSWQVRSQVFLIPDEAVEVLPQAIALLARTGIKVTQKSPASSKRTYIHAEYKP